MHYWNQENFEGLEAIADHASLLPALQGFGEYCRLRAGGLRKQALRVLRAFLKATASLSFDERKQVVTWLLETKFRSPKVHKLLPQPVFEELMRPT
jgi:hypothetical protein